MPFPHLSFISMTNKRGHSILFVCRGGGGGVINALYCDVFNFYFSRICFVSISTKQSVTKKTRPYKCEPKLRLWLADSDAFCGNSLIVLYFPVQGSVWESGRGHGDCPLLSGGKDECVRHRPTWSQPVWEGHRLLLSTYCFYFIVPSQPYTKRLAGQRTRVPNHTR